MSLMNCPECGKEVSNEAKLCPNCGHPIKENAKKPKWIWAIAIICGIIALFVLVSAFTDLRKSAAGKKEDTLPTTIETTDEENQEIIFEPNTDEELATLPDSNGYIKSVVTTAKQTGINDINKTEIGNHKELSGMHLISAKCEAGTGIIIIIDSIYTSSTNTWTTISIRNFDNGIYYFVQNDQKPYFDIYDYNTGELISKKTKNLGDIDIIEDFNKKIDEADKNFEDSLEDISNKYK